MSTRTLPLRPNLDQLKIQANELHRDHREGHPSAAARIVAHHPEMKSLSLQAVLDQPLSLADAQLVIAREYGFESWPTLKHRVELADAVAKFTPHPRFDEAVAAMDVGDLDRLRSLIASDPSLVHARTNLEPQYGYFTGATLLHHVAGNPDRGRLEGNLPPLPKNSPEIARLLLNAGAEVHARTLGPNGGDTMGLLVTSKQASDADVTGSLIDVLLKYGATLDLQSDDCLDSSLANHAPRAAEKMIALGAKPDLLAAAALGRMDLLRGLFDSEGRLLSRPRRHGKEMTDRDAIGLAMLYAYVREQREAVDFLLEKDGNWNMIGVNNGAVLHRAAIAGDLNMVERLVAKGADVSNRDNPFVATPLSWADHNNQREIVQWMREHCVIDLHDAVSFDLREHVEARLREDPSSVNSRIDQWDMPQCTPLHCAADTKREELTKLLLENGADPNILAGNGMTALDVADYHGAAGVAALLEQHGGTRATRATNTTKTSPQALALYRIDEERNTIQVRQGVSDREWDAIVAIMAEQKIAGLDASGQMTDGALERVAELDHVTRLLLGGSKQVTDASLARLDGLFALSFFWHSPAFTADGLKVLAALPNLGFLGCQGENCTDAAMHHMSAIPRLRMLMAQDTVAGDEGFIALSKSATIEYLWGRRCYNLTGRGFAALSTMPALRGLSVSCKNVDDAALSTLARFPALREFMPMDVPDAGFRHIGRCENLEALWCMYCRDTTDAATEHIAGLSKLKTYYAGQTKITDRSLELLSRMPSLETLEFWNCAGITDDGVAFLAALSRLREVNLDGCRAVTPEVAAVFPAHVRVKYSA